jgi:hypothetical protein
MIGDVDKSICLHFDKMRGGIVFGFFNASNGSILHIGFSEVEAFDNMNEFSDELATLSI